ncbi:hypothetical protein [Metabacillus endolithicus]|uniref:hypothetical protein n=1 Tax=Metabacillus endolithicus TaxID=1535204 RepID=UPI00366B589A
MIAIIIMLTNVSGSIFKTVNKTKTLEQETNSIVNIKISEPSKFPFEIVSKSNEIIIDDKTHEFIYRYKGENPERELVLIIDKIVYENDNRSSSDYGTEEYELANGEASYYLENEDVQYLTFNYKEYLARIVYDFQGKKPLNVQELVKLANQVIE